MFCFSKFCRLCLAENEPLICYKTDDIDGISYFDKLKWTMPLLVKYAPEHIPTLICNKCKEELCLTYEFMQNCLKSHTLLEKYYLQLNLIDINEGNHGKINKTNSSNILRTSSVSDANNLQLIKQNTFSCSICELNFSEKHILENHKKIVHAGIIEYKCHICENMYVLKEKLREHVTELHYDANTGNYKCHVCPLTFAKSNYLKLHLKNHATHASTSTEVHSIQINLGTSSFIPKTQEFKDLPVKNKPEIDSGTNTASTTLVKKKVIYQKNGAHFKKQSLHCQFCDDSFNDKKLLFRHKDDVHFGIIVNEENEMSQNIEHIIINDSFSTIKIEESIQHNENESPEIHKKIDIEKAIKIELEILTPEQDTIESERYECDVCNGQFASLALLNEHKLIHRKPPYSCELCNKKFSLLAYLNRHKVIHSGERPYPCDMCSKTFVTSYSLSRHKRTHTGERPYWCDLCDKKFAISSTLIAHRRIHTKDRPYACNICNKKFAVSATLAAHKRTHMREEQN